MTIHVYVYQGFEPEDAMTEHGFHVHVNGSLGNACKDAGGHFNPYGKDHGGPRDTIRYLFS